MDNSSTTKPAPEVVEAVCHAMKNQWGNPSSLHRLGSSAQQMVEKARASVAAVMDVSPVDIYFTSGGTEANNLAIFGTLRSLGKRRNHIITSAVEHPSVMETFRFLEQEGCQVTFLGVDPRGLVDPQEVMAAVKPETALVSIMLVQNEIGTIEPCQDIGGGLVKLGRNRPRFHVDGVQGFAKLQINPKKWGIDMLSMSAHKIHGPKGVGALYVRKGVNLTPLSFGGGQELGLRSGTENLPGIVGFGVACDLWKRDARKIQERVSRLRAGLISGVTQVYPEAVLHGPEVHNVSPYIANFSFPGYRGETVLHALAQQGVYVSTGSACSSRSAKPSATIMALGRNQAEALSSVRFSMSRYTTEEEVKATVTALKSALDSLKAWKSRPGR